VINKDVIASMEDTVSRSRRHLLKLGAYVPPAIVGMAFISSMPGTANAGSAGSCKPTACKPCMSGGKKSDAEKNKDRVDCAISQRQRE